MARARQPSRSGDQGSRSARGSACTLSCVPAKAGTSPKKWSLGSCLRRSTVILSLYARKIRDPANGIAEAGEQVEPAGALRLIGVVHRHMIEEGIDRAAKAGERLHRAGEILCLDRSARLRLSGVERSDQ